MASKADGAAAEVELFPGTNVEGMAGRDELYAIQSYADALTLLGLDGASPEEVNKLLTWDTNPYQIVDKAELVGQPLLIVQWHFNAGDFGEYVFVNGIVRLGNGSDWMVAFTDGGSGIYQQLRSLTDARLADQHPKPQEGALVLGGLVKSEYDYSLDNGESGHGVTYYLSNNTRKAA